MKRNGIYHCKWCADYAEFRRMAFGNPSKRALKGYVERLFDRLQHTEMDLNVDEAILDGSWPSAKDYLSRGMEAAIALAAKDGAK